MKLKQYKYIFTFLCFYSINISYAQLDLHFADRIIVGTSLTYIRESNQSSYFNNTFHELTWDKNIAININRHFYIGLNYKNIYTQGSAYSSSEVKRNHSLGGLFTQFDFNPKKKHRIFAELSFDIGNYCTCGDADPYLKSTLYYLGFGGGADLPIGKYISIDFGFVGHLILNKLDSKVHDFTQYIVGLNFDLIRKRK